jgi:hypothetical protein
MGRAISIALELHDVPDDLHGWVGKTAAGRSWSPTNDNVTPLWTALSGDKIRSWSGWQAYKNGTERPHGSLRLHLKVSRIHLFGVPFAVCHFVDRLLGGAPSPHVFVGSSIVRARLRADLDNCPFADLTRIGQKLRLHQRLPSLVWSP